MTDGLVAESILGGIFTACVFNITQASVFIGLYWWDVLGEQQGSPWLAFPRNTWHRPHRISLISFCASA